ncbi:MAG: DUF3333 domain-containing protein, partial [Pseudomonadota bacterium]
MASIDFTELSAKHTSDATRTRLRQRHWAQIRLQAYGIAAIAFAAAALILLASTIVGKTTAVVYEYYLTLDAQIEVSERDMERLESDNPLLGINLRRVVGASLEETVRGEVDRRDQRALTGLVSSESGLELGAVVKADMGVIGQTISFDALLDDNTQLYLKGSFGRPDAIRSTGEAVVTPGEEEGKVSVKVGPSALTEIFEALRERRSYEAQRAAAERDRQQNAIDVTIDQLATETDPDLRARLEGRLEAYQRARDAAEEKRTELRRRATERRTITFEMSDDDPTLFLKLGGGWIKAETVAREQVTGFVMEPVEGERFGEGDWQALMMERPDAQRPINDRQVVWLEDLEERGLIVTRLNTRLLSFSDSASAELAGIWGAVVGSFWTMLVTFLLAFPIGVMASIYLEEFAPKNRVTDLIEVNINNLAAVPSIVFGLLGLAIFVAGV